MSAANSSEEYGPWLNVEQAARYLAMPSVKAIYQAVRRGQLPVYRLGNRLRFRREELDSLLAQNHRLTAADMLVI